jgi:hypothetical protein
MYSVYDDQDYCRRMMSEWERRTLGDVFYSIGNWAMCHCPRHPP